MTILNWKEILYPYEQAVSELIVKLESISKGYSIFGNYSPINSVYGRVKSISSIIAKATKKNIPFAKIEDLIEDIAGIRILCQFVEDIDKIISLIKQLDLTIIEERDYITNTKESGYRSYHIIIKYYIFTVFGCKEVFAEIQIRTLAMNSWATIEHSLKYKYNGNIPESVKAKLVKCANAAFELDYEMSCIRDEILEAQKITQIKSQLIEDILKLLQNLYYSKKFEDVGILHKKFFDIYYDDDIDKLFAFKQQLDIIYELYKL